MAPTVRPRRRSRIRQCPSPWAVRSAEITIKRRFAGRKLAPGTYRLELVAKDAAGNESVVKRIGFRIKA
jgi:hypothetical protein